MKKTLIVYKTKHGCTETVAAKISGGLSGDTTLWNLNQRGLPPLSDFDSVVVGGSIHAGRMQGKVRRFLADHWKEIRAKRLGLFLCCMETGEKARKQLEDAFLSEYREHASAVGLMGGEFNLDRMNFVEKFIVKKVAGVTESSSNINEENIQAFIDAFNRQDS